MECDVLFLQQRWFVFCEIVDGGSVLLQVYLEIFESECMLWLVQEIVYDSIDVVCVCENGMLFYFVVSVLFVESGFDFYVGNFVQYYVDCFEIVYWLIYYWECEEFQYGCVLCCYVEIVWFEFDWECGYVCFFDEYLVICLVDQFELMQVLEMVVCCVVEMGIVIFYWVIV